MMRNDPRRPRLTLGALAAFALLSGAPSAAAQETRISGLFFGDAYLAARHHDGDIEGMNGFWARRMYFTADTRFSPSWDARVRFEAASPGDFKTAGTADAFVKDLWMRWTHGAHRVLVGISSSPTWNLIEGEWGYRDVEKTPLDLYKMGSSRDFGVAAQGSLDAGKKVRYHVMVGNGAGEKSETDEGKKLMGALQLYPNAHVVLEAFADREDRAGDKDRTTLGANGVLRGEKGRVGFTVARQTRRSPGLADTDVDVLSVFAVLKAGSRANVLARWDRLGTPIPDADKIAYFRMAPTSKGSFLLLGLDLALDARVHLIPNLELVSYDDDTLRSDVFLKTTFSVTF